MIKVFIPINKKRDVDLPYKNIHLKTNIRGFWLSPEGKVYYDYLKVKHYSFFNPSITAKEFNQEAIFYIKDNKGYCFNNNNKLTDVLSNRIYSEVKPENLKSEIREALKAYGGVTIYIEGNKYFKEIFFK